MKVCTIRKDLLEQGLSVSIGNNFVNTEDVFGYRWVNAEGQEDKDGDVFQVRYLGMWQEAQSIDFDFKEINVEGIQKPVGLTVGIAGGGDTISNPHVRIDEFRGNPVVTIGAGAPHNTEILEAAIKMAKENNIGIIVNDISSCFGKEKIAVNLDNVAIPVLKGLSQIPELPCLDPDTPNKLQMLRDLKLSPEQIDYFQNAPPHRLEGEKQEDYKTRRMLNKLIIKYRGQF